MKHFYRITKRIIDLMVALGVLLLSFPVFVVLMIGLGLEQSGSPFFKQKRPGKMEKPFYILKFKTMLDTKDEQGNLLPDRDRLTKLGAIVRKLSLDEIPQLFNVIKGDMSLVGPRPLLMKYLPLYSEEQKLRHTVKPGITGLAQVNGRNSISWTKKFDYDIQYVRSASLLMDFKIMIKTVQKVIQREGVNQSEARPMNPFNGSN